MPCSSPTADGATPSAANGPLALGLNTHDGAVTYAPVAEAHGFESVDLQTILGKA